LAASHFIHRFYVLLALTPLSALGEETSPGVPSSTFIQAFLGLAAIIALLVLTAYLGRKIWGGKGFGQGGLNIIGGVALSPRERIVLIEAGDTWLVVGVVPGQIRTLHHMPKGSVASGNALTGAPFAHWLKQFSERKPGV
jgi:flagellar protein FliO/FliZ